MALIHLNLADAVELVPCTFTKLDDPLHDDNPLGKMPVLVTEDAGPLYDSPVILEYLDAHAGPRLFPAPGPDRWATLKLQALADGVMDAAVLITMEGRMRPEDKRCPDWIAFQKRKVDRGFAAASALNPDPARVDVGTISLACALGFVDFRGQSDWRTPNPDLVGWLDAFRAAAPEYDATTPIAA